MHPERSLPMKALAHSVSLCVLLLLSIGTAATAGLNDHERGKLHPRFQILLDEWRQNRPAANADVLHDAIILTPNPGEVKRAGIRVNSVYPGFVTVRRLRPGSSVLASLDAVRFVDPGSVNELHTEVSGSRKPEHLCSMRGT
jgi:hypothetical protein